MLLHMLVRSQRVVPYSLLGPDTTHHPTPKKELGTRQEMTSYHPGTTKAGSTYPTEMLSCLYLYDYQI